MCSAYDYFEWLLLSLRRASRGSNISSTSVSQQQLAEIIGSFKELWRNEIIRNLKEETRNQIEEENWRSLEKMKQELKKAIQIEFSLRGSQYSPPIQADIQQLVNVWAQTGVTLKLVSTHQGKKMLLLLYQLWDCMCNVIILHTWWPSEKYMKVMQSYPARALDRRLQVDWARDPREGPRILMSLRVDFDPMG